MGPEGGVKGGKIIAEGKPEEICKFNESYTGKFLKEVLNYEYLIESLDDVLSLGRFSLLETLAHRLLEEVSIPNSVKAASVVITKLDVLNGDGTLGCSMTKIK